ncbi:MAG: tRNA (guanosine(46)-N(7))-methyltransferase TrmB [Stappiaceae bacterium]
MTEPYRGTFYGRRVGKPLKGRQADLMRTLFPDLKIDLSSGGDLAPVALFGKPFKKNWIEIGFGGGEHFIHQLNADTASAGIGCEPFVSGMAKAVASISAGRLEDRVRLFDDDAAILLDRLVGASLDRAFLLYPDPWPKKRHWKRRFISGQNLDRLAKVLKPGSEFRFASDIDSYVRWTIDHIAEHSSFDQIEKNPEKWLQPWPDWPGTRYEAKALREGRQPKYLTFRRV